MVYEEGSLKGIINLSFNRCILLSPSQLMQLSLKVQSLLNSTILAVNAQQRKEAAKQLCQVSSSNDYISILIDIILKETSSEQLILAALKQIKDAVTSELMKIDKKVDDKNSIHHRKICQVTKLFLSVIRQLSNYHQYAALIKDIIRLLSKDCVQIADVIAQQIRTRGEVLSCLKYILSAYRSSTMKTVEINQVFKRSIDILPFIASQTQGYLNNFYITFMKIQESKRLQSRTSHYFFQEEVIYLLIKFAYKSRLCQTRCNGQVYSTFIWAQIALYRLRDNIYSVYQQSLNREKHSLQYSYFHGKKWAVKYLTKFVKLYSNQGKLQREDLQEKEISQIISKSCDHFFTILQPEYLLLRKLLFFQAMLLYRKDLLLKSITVFMKQYLPTLFAKRVQKIEQFFLHHKQHNQKKRDSTKTVLKPSQLKKVICQIWIKSSIIDAVLQPQINGDKLYMNGLHFLKSMQMLNDWIKGHSLKMIEFGISILCYMPQIIKENCRVKLLISELMEKCWKIYFQSNDLILKLNVLRFIKLHGEAISNSTIHQMKMHIQDQITGNFTNQLRWLGIAALQGIAKKGKGLLEKESPVNIKDVFAIIVRDVQNYQTEQLMVSLNLVVDAYADKLKEFVLFVINEANNLIFIAKDPSHLRQSGQNYQFMRDGALKIIESMMIHIDWKDQGIFTRKRTIRNRVQRSIIDSIEKMFLTKSFHQYFPYYKQTLRVFNNYLKAHLVNNAQMTSSTKDLFRIFLCRISALTNIQISSLQRCNMSQNHEVIFKKCEGKDQQYYHAYFMIIRTYIQILPLYEYSIRYMEQIFQDIFAANDLEFLFSALFHAFYTIKDGRISNETNSIERRKLALNILIALYEIQGLSLRLTAHLGTQRIIIINIKAGLENQMLSILNAQLFGVWLWNRRVLNESNKNQTKFYSERQQLIYVVNNVRYFFLNGLQTHFKFIKKQQQRIIKGIMLGLVSLINIFSDDTVGDSLLFKDIFNLAFYFAEEQKAMPSIPRFIYGLKNQQILVQTTKIILNQNEVQFDSFIDTLYKYQYEIKSCKLVKSEEKVIKDELFWKKIDELDPSYSTFMDGFSQNVILVSTIKYLNQRKPKICKEWLKDHYVKLHNIVRHLANKGLAFEQLTKLQK